MSKRNNGGRVTLGMIKGKPLNTSVPSIAIRFHANAEELEELYLSDDEATDRTKNDSASISSAGEPDSSPLRGYFPKLTKRSASIDTSPSVPQDSSPPSDPWRFFSDIKGKITKSVEDKLTEIKSRNHEEESPRKLNPVKDSKESSSVSDSEELSESSISKTCGGVSTTEGVEMSTDEDTPSLENDAGKQPEQEPEEEKKTEGPKPLKSIIRQRFRMLKNRTTFKEGTVGTSSLQNLYSINTGLNASASDVREEEVESGVDALEDEFRSRDDEPGTSTGRKKKARPILKSWLRGVTRNIDNIEVDEDNVLNVSAVSGTEMRTMYLAGADSRTIFAPSGFVDLRTSHAVTSETIKYFAGGFLFLIIYYFIQVYSVFLGGMVVGIVMCYAIITVYERMFPLKNDLSGTFSPVQSFSQIIEIPAVKEYHPVTKFEGWINELPDVYDPFTYHICQTQPVFLRLQGNMLRMSHTRAKIPKRLIWNESIKASFTFHRIYNLYGARIYLLPEGLTKKRHWSKKYPICIELNNDQMDYQEATETRSTQGFDISEKKESMKSNLSVNKKKVTLQTQQFSKLTEEEETFDADSEHSRQSTPPPLNTDQFQEDGLLTDDISNVLEDLLEVQAQEGEQQFEDDVCSLPDDWCVEHLDEISEKTTKLYFFTRSNREKEDWFRRLVKATHKGANVISEEFTSVDLENQASVSSTLITDAVIDDEYNKYMAVFTKPVIFKGYKLEMNKSSIRSGLNQSFLDRNKSTTKSATSRCSVQSMPETLDDISCDTMWVNAFLGRILFDCVRDENFTMRVRERIQRKLSAIKLPYFIEELIITELSVGNTSPFIHEAGLPVLDQRGLWVDMEMTYEGSFVLILQTKLNLMKLKHPHAEESEMIKNKQSAIFHSDVDDSPESSSDDESAPIPQELPNKPVLDQFGHPLPTVGGTSNSSKKFMKMVDKITESKFFQAATENKYIKHIMEGVSNTDLRLRVEVKSFNGTLVLNIPPPPTDRVWFGFRPVPKMQLSAMPIVGERSISMMRVVSWIEKKMLQEFQKVMVVPNMEDLIIPVMCPKLPE